MRIATLFILLFFATFSYSEEITHCPQKLQRIEGYDPSYPIRESRQPVDGWVVLTARLNPDGELEEVDIVESVPDKFFDRSVLNAVSSWKFDWSGSWCKYKTKLSFVFSG
ncbi:energy transducer TonB [Microbulbifer sp. TRSA001]|uniref:energy transducer TonB n=1 Tax=Microbulbifer sp. TRSA001 TaxID=3243381 RepID=UPI004039009C